MIINNSFGSILAIVKSILILLIWIITWPLMGQQTNPFDIIRSGEDVIPEVISIPKTSTGGETELSTKLEGDNPFDISHIPIRKNQYEEIKRLQTKIGGEEDISIASLPLQILIVSLCLLAFILFRRKDHLAIIIRTMLNNNYLKSASFEYRGGLTLEYLLGFVLFVLNLGLFAHLILIKLFDIEIEYQILWLCLAILVFFGGRHIANAVFSWIFNVQKEAVAYNYAIISLNNMNGIGLLTINFIIIFGASGWVRSLAIAGVALFLLLQLVRYYNSILIGQRFVSQYFVHFFIYLCAFEFAPWVVVYSMVKNMIV